MLKIFIVCYPKSPDLDYLFFERKVERLCTAVLIYSLFFKDATKYPAKALNKLVKPVVMESDSLFLNIHKYIRRPTKVRLKSIATITEFV